MAHAGSRVASRRTYRSPIREERARRTRERIVAAARTEFLRSGYAGTTMRAVARSAGVSVATVELAFGTKPALLHAAISFSIRGDVDPTPMLEREWARAAADAGSAGEFLATVARVVVDSAQRSAGLIAAALEAAVQDPTLLSLARQLRAQRAETAAWVVDGVVKRAPLRPGIDRAQAIETVWLLMDPRVYRAATAERAWRPERFGQWFCDAVARLLTLEPTASVQVQRRTGTPLPRGIHGTKLGRREDD